MHWGRGLLSSPRVSCGLVKICRRDESRKANPGNPFYEILKNAKNRIRFQFIGNNEAGVDMWSISTLRPSLEDLAVCQTSELLTLKSPAARRALLLSLYISPHPLNTIMPNLFYTQCKCTLCRTAVVCLTGT